MAHMPVVREKPFLQANAAGEFSVRVPELYSDSVGITWRGGETPGDNSDYEVLYRAPGCGYGGDDQRGACPRQEPDSDAGDLRAHRPDSRDAATCGGAGAGVCDATSDEGHGGDDDGRCGRDRDCGATLRRGAERVASAAGGGAGGKPGAPCERPDHAARCFLSRGWRGSGQGQSEFEDQQQRHTGGPYVDLESRPRRRGGL